jgi:hypothetical protein
VFLKVLPGCCGNIGSIAFLCESFLESMFPVTILCTICQNIFLCLILFFGFTVDTSRVKRREEFISHVLHKWRSFESTDRKRN